MRGRHLERSCSGWVAPGPAAGGVQRLAAWFAGAPYARHRHDHYAIGVTDSGVQGFWYRGGRHASLPGDVVVLHPDEVHDGYAGSEEGFGYRILYVAPARVWEACRAIAGRGSLPFVPQPVVKSARLRAVLQAAFAADMAPLASDALVLSLAEALLALAGKAARPIALDLHGVRRARELLDGAGGRRVHAAELERVSGLSRFELARQFRAQLGTSPYRYLRLRRLDWARERIATRPLAELALAAGFADQAHFTRAFKAAFGMPPARYAQLRSCTIRGDSEEKRTWLQSRLPSCR